MKISLFEKLRGLEGKELWLLIGAAAVLVLLSVLFFRKRSLPETEHPAEQTKPRALVYGAFCLTLSFLLSYFKLFSMPFGGSVTLLSMMPLMIYASCFGPKRGFAAAFAYSLLQIVQGAWIVHPVQFVLDYLVAFTCLGLPSLIPDRLTAGCALGGFARMLVSTVSGAVFFSDSGMEYGILNPWVFSLLYNFLTIGIETLLCIGASFIPGIRKIRDLMRKASV